MKAASHHAIIVLMAMFSLLHITFPFTEARSVGFNSPLITATAFTPNLKAVPPTSGNENSEIRHKESAGPIVEVEAETIPALLGGSNKLEKFSQPPKTDEIDRNVMKYVMDIRPLGHSPGAGHDAPPDPMH